MSRRRGSRTTYVLYFVVVAVVGVVVGSLVTASWMATSPAATSAGPTARETTTTTAPATTTSVPVELAEPMVIEMQGPAVGPDEAVRRAQRLASAGLRPPSDCPLDLDNERHLPNAPREYRVGVHQGVDFFCGGPGHDAVAALDGRVVAASLGYQEPSTERREAMLEVARDLGRTPAAILQALWGRHVVIDHGVVPEVGHVTSVYAHLTDLDGGLELGADIDAGQRIGQIGVSGTSTGASGEDDPAEIHLHWEIHVDDRPLGEALSAEDTRRVYEALLAGS